MMGVVCCGKVNTANRETEHGQLPHIDYLHIMQECIDPD